jgi:hypothetical protein
LTRLDFIVLLTTEVQLRGKPFDSATLGEWLNSMSPHIQEDPCRGSGELLNPRRARSPVRQKAGRGFFARMG